MGEKFDNPILNFLATKIGDDGLTDEERSRLKKVMKSFNFEVKSKNKMMNMLAAPIKKQVNNAQKDFEDHISMMSKITNLKIKQKFQDINMKALAAAQIENQEDRKNALKMVELEQKDAMIGLWLDFKHGYEANRLTKFGLKDENSISRFVQETMKQQQNNQSEILQAPHSTHTKEKAQSEKMILAMNIMNTLQSDVSPQKEDRSQNKAVLEIIKMKHVIDKTEKKHNEKELLQRAKENSLFLSCYELMNHKYFTNFISFCILGNTLVLALNKFPTTGRRELVQSSINEVFYLIFFGEMIVKILGEGPKSYFLSFFNVFDCLIIIISTFDLVLDNIDVTQSQFLGGLRVLRVFRLLRVFKLAKVWKDLNDLLTTMGIVIMKLVYLLIFLLCFLITYSILGKEFFAFKMAFDVNDQPVENFFDFKTGKTSGEGTYPDFNFNTFMDSVISVFILMTGDSWSGVYYNLARMPGINKVLSFFFCYSAFICGKMILLQLFVAILVQEFDERSIITKIEDDEIAKKNNFSIFRFLKELCVKGCCCLKQKKYLEDQKENEDKIQKDSITSDDEKGKKDEENNQIQSDRQQGQILQENKQTEPKKDRSLFCLTRDNKCRNFFIQAEVLKIKGIAVLDTLIWSAIIISSVQLAFDSPVIDPNSKLHKTMDIINYVMTLMFTVEVLIKVISKGFLLNGKKSYLRNKANILDFFIVMFAIIDISVTGVNLSFIKIIRMAKLVRPMRLVFRNENLTITIKALIAAMPKIFNLMILTLLIYTVFGIIGINLFAGEFYFCQTGQIIGFDLLTGNNSIKSEFDCINSGGEWVKWYTNFDNLPTAMIQMFQMAMEVGWEDTMIRAMKTKGIGENMNFYPPYGTKVYKSLFFFMWVVIGCFFLQNLFVGVVISQYNREGEKLGKNFVLTEEQKNAVETKQMLVKTNPKYRNVEPTNVLRKFCFNLCEPPKEKSWNVQNLKIQLTFNSATDFQQKIRMSNYFEYFITATILLNTIVLTLKWPNMSTKTQSATETINYVCTSIFIIEAIIKLLGLGKNYFKDGWNVFDFIIVVSSIIFFHPYFKKSKSTITVMRAFRVGRVLKSLKKLKQLRDIFSTILRTLPGLINVGVLILLIVYLFAIIGVQTFGAIKLNGPMQQWLNFQTLPKAYLSLYVVLTGEGSNEILQAVSMEKSATNNCIHNPTYEDYVANGYQTIGCGKRLVATIYFCIFCLLVPIICMNLLIAIILSGYSTIQDNTKNDDLNKMIEIFQEEWSYYDPDAKGIIAEKDFQPFMFRLGKPLGFPASYAVMKEQKNQFISRFEQQQPKHCADVEGRWFFNEVLDQLIFFYAVKNEMGWTDEDVDNENDELKPDKKQEKNREEEINLIQTFDLLEKKKMENQKAEDQLQTLKLLEHNQAESSSSNDLLESSESLSVSEQDKSLLVELQIQMSEPCSSQEMKLKVKEFSNFAKDFQIDIHAEEEPERVVNKLKGIL